MMRDSSCAESTLLQLNKRTDVSFPGVVVIMKGVLKVSVEIVRVCGKKRSSDRSSTERCAESEPPYTTDGVAPPAERYDDISWRTGSWWTDRKI